MGRWVVELCPHGGSRGYCAECKRAYAKAWYRRNRRHVKTLRAAYYKRTKPAFQKRYLRWRLAHREQENRRLAYWRQQHPRRHRDQVLRRMYGITAKQWTEMRKAQDGRCLICSKKRPLHVDHDHRSGKVRALLCALCNRMIGLAKESPSTLRAAALYLIAWRRR